MTWLILLALQDDLIQNLGSEVYAERERAQAELVRRGTAAYDDVFNARDHADPEVRYRIGQILNSPAFVLESVRRGRFDRLGSDHWKEAVRQLMAFPSGLKEALREGADRIQGPARLRSRQLIQVLSNGPVDGLVYGIVLESDVTHENGIGGVEIWINATDRPMILEDHQGDHHLTRIQVAHDGGSSWVMGSG